MQILSIMATQNSKISLDILDKKRPKATGRFNPQKTISLDFVVVDYQQLIVAQPPLSHHVY